MTATKHTVHVKDVMKESCQMIDGLSTIAEALDVFKQHNCSVLFVKKRNENDEFGMLKLSDIGRQVLAVDRAPQRVNVYEIMTKPVVSVLPTMDVRYCARLFVNINITMAPVIENDTIIGVVGYDDIVLKGLCPALEQ